MERWHFRLVAERSRARVVAAATGHDFVAEGAGVDGEAELVREADGRSRLVRLSARFPLAALDAGDALKNFELRRFMNLKAQPLATAELLAPLELLEPPAQSHSTESSAARSGKGRMRFAIAGDGPSRALETELTVEEALPHATARFSLSFRGLGYTPPKVLFLTVQDLLRVEVAVVLSQAEGA